MVTLQKFVTCLWFDGQAQEAAQFYTSIFPNSRVDRIMHCHLDWPGGTAGDVVVVGFTLAGQAFQALNGGPGVDFSEAMSISVTCENQPEVDHYWAALTAGGGEPIMCGWLKDKFGVRWQIVPRTFYELIESGDVAQNQRVMAAMMSMVKMDVEELKTASIGDEASTT